MRTASSRLVVAAFLSMALIAAACGSDTDTATTESVPTAPITVDVYGTPFTIDARPERIVSLSPSATEGLFAIGAGPQVIAVDDASDFPAEAPTTTLSGVTPNVEAIVAFDPDLVVVSFDPSDLIASLEAAGIPVLLLDAAVDLDDVMRQLEILGAVTGNLDTAYEVVMDLEARISVAVAATPELAEPLTYFHLLDETLFTVTSSTFAGSVYGLFGLVNVADAADPDGSTGGYPQLSAEFLVDADPDLVFLANGDVASFRELPVLGGLRAVEEDGIIELLPDVSSRFGPRIADFVEQVAEVVTRLAAGALVLVR